MRLRKLLALVLAMVMLVSSVPTAVFATETDSASSSESKVPAVVSPNNLFLDKTATLKEDGTYTIDLEAYATGTPITKTVELGVPLDVVLVVDQSGSLKNSGSVDSMKNSIRNFMNALKANGEAVGVDHRVSICSFAGDDLAGLSGPADEKYGYSFAGDLWDLAWLNTGLYVDGKFQDYGTVEYTRIDSLAKLDTTRSYLVKYTRTLENGSSVAEYFRIYYYKPYASWYIHNSKEGLVSLATRKQDGDDKTTSEELITKYEVYDIGKSTLQLDQADYAASWEYIADGQGNLNADVAAAINSLASNGGTRTSYGLKMARNMLKYITPGTDNDIRKKVVVVFTDGKAGAGWNSDGEMAATLAEANKIKASGVDIYTVGVYSNAVATDIASFMNQFSSNCDVIEFSENPTTEYEYHKLDQNTWVNSVTGRYRTLPSFYKVENEDGTVEFCPVRVRVETRYSDAAKDWVVTPPYKWTYITDTGEMPIPTELLNEDGTAIKGLYKIGSGDYNSEAGYYQTSNSFDNLSSLFQTVLDKETIFSSEVELGTTAILKDVLADGFTLTDNTQITVSVVPGSVSEENSNLSPNELTSDKITWSEEAKQVLTFNYKEAKEGTGNVIVTGAADQTEMTLTATAENGEIHVTGYNYAAQFISKDHVGSKLVVTVTGVEADKDIVTDSTTVTNKGTSGIYEGPERDADGDGVFGEMQASFPIPTTYLSSKTYYLDYTGKITIDPKDFLMTGESINVDGDGYHYFGEPGTTVYTEYGKITVNEDGTITYELVGSDWEHNDVFYLFGTTEDPTVKGATANANGNMWSKITIVPPEDIRGKLYVDKTATLTDNGTYTIDLEAYATGTPAITALSTGVPLDVVLVIDQSGSLQYVTQEDGTKQFNGAPLAALKASVSSFVHELQANGDANGLNHRISICGFGSDEYIGWSGVPEYDNADNYTYAGELKDIYFTNTGLFVNGEFKKYGASTYEPFIVEKVEDVVDNKIYVAREKGTQRYLPVYYYPGHTAWRLWVSSGWTTFFNKDLTDEEKAAIKEAYGSDKAGANAAIGEAEKKLNVWAFLEKYDLYYLNREVTVQLTDEDYQNSWENVSVNGSVNPDIAKTIDSLAGNGATFSSYGMRMARKMLENAPATADGVERKKVVIVFTDGVPGGTGVKNKGEAESTLAEAQKIKDGLFDKNGNAINAEIYTVGIYEGETEGDNEFMNQLSSNCASHKFADEPVSAVLDPSQEKYLAIGRYLTLTPYFYKLEKENGDVEYCPIKVFRSSTSYDWRYVSDEGLMTIPAGMVSSDDPKTITGVYTLESGEYNPDLGYYSSSDNFSDLPGLFREIVKEVSTYSSEVQLDAKAILKDVMADGFTLTNNTQITVSVVPGSVKEEFADVGANRLGSEHISWGAPQEVLTFKYSEAKEGTGKVVVNGAADQTEMTLTAKVDENGVLTVTGFNYADPSDNYKDNAQYIAYGHAGSKLLVTITGVEADKDIVTDSTTVTNKGTSGIYEGPESDVDGDGEKGEIQATFPMPTTHLTSKVYVVDYARKLNIDPADFKMNLAVDNLDVDGYNYFNPAISAITEKYGKIAVEDSKVSYTPTNTNWDGYDTFYVFGATDDATIQSAVANANGNMWAKVSVIPANNVYYEDTFVTDTESGTVGIVYSGSWTEDGTAGNQKENAESGEDTTADGAQGGVHGWEDSLADDNGYSDGSAHMVSYDKNSSATATFTFTGTGVDIYSRTNRTTGAVIAMLYEGETSKDVIAKYTLRVDNLAASGDYYQIPTLSLCQTPAKDENGNFIQDADGNTVMTALPYGTYTVKLIVSKASGAQTGEERFLYYLDGIRVYNPIKDLESDETVSGAYGEEELNATFVEIRDKLLDANSFSAEDDGLSAGPVFIDRVTDEEGNHTDNTETVEIGTYKVFGPENEVYLSAFQRIAFAVEYREGAHYYIGMKTLTGEPAGVVLSDAKGYMETISIDHTTDLYYEVYPVWTDLDGNYYLDETGNRIGIIIVEADMSNGDFAMDENGDYIVDENGDLTYKGSILALTKLKVTGPTASTFKFAMVRNSVLLNHVADVANTDSSDAEEPGEEEEPTDPTEPSTPDVDIDNPEPEKDDYRDELKEMYNLLKRLYNNLRRWFRP